jgi:hypothetical protein
LGYLKDVASASEEEEDKTWKRENNSSVLRFKELKIMKTILM